MRLYLFVPNNARKPECSVMKLGIVGCHTYMMAIIEYIQFLNGNAFRLDGERFVCACECECAELLRMNMHKQLNGEWSLSRCVRMSAVCFIKEKNKDRKKATHAHTHRQMRRCTMKERRIAMYV